MVHLDILVYLVLLAILAHGALLGTLASLEHPAIAEFPVFRDILVSLVILV